MTKQSEILKRRAKIVAIVALTVTMLAGRSPAADDTAAKPPIGRTRFLLLDSRLIDTTENARLAVGKVKKHPANPLFGETMPWETDTSHMYANVVFDREEKLYKCWYYSHLTGWESEVTPGRLAPKNETAGGNTATLYAVSKDGIKWEKPGLDVYRYKGKPTNIVQFRDHGTGVFKDPRDPDPNRRYKLFCSNNAGNLYVAFSPDGIRWTKRLLVGKGRGDTHNNALWAPDLNKYVAFTRGVAGRSWRYVMRMESEDFVKWTQPVEVLRGPQTAQTYSMPVFYHAGVYLGLPALLRGGGPGRVTTELTWSPDTKVWHFVPENRLAQLKVIRIPDQPWRRVDEGTQFIPLAEKEDSYEWGCIYAAATPVVLDDEIRIYYSAQKGKHSWQPGQLCLATLRPDGWTGYTQQDKAKPAAIVTKPVLCGGKTLRVTADILRGGSVKATILNAAGKAVAESALIAKTVTDAEVQWKEGYSLEKLKGKDIRLRFQLKDAKLYSFSFHE